MLKKGILCFVSILISALVAGNAFAAGEETAPLVVDTDYTITLQKLTSAGALETLETTTGTTDGEGVLSFTLSNVPSKDEANFIFVTVTDNNGVVVRKGVAPAPPPNDNNATGLNYLSTKQADALIRAAEVVGSDDPIVAAYMFIILRSPGVSVEDLENIAMMGIDALTDGEVGFESYLLSHGVSQQQLADLKKCLIYNPDETRKTLRDFARNFFNAVDAVDETSATEEMQKAGGFMAEVFLDAGICAGIDAGKILSAHDAAGDGAEAGGHMALLSPGVLASIETSMTTFNRRISIVRITAEYTKALNTLGASGAQVTQFLDGVNGMMQANAAVDIEFSGYFMDRETYLADAGVTDAEVQEAMNQAYSTAWTQFQGDIAASDADIDAMIAQLEAANDGLVLPQGFGQWNDQSGNLQNWPVPQVVLMGWMADTTFAYGPRDDSAIPDSMALWMGSCDNTMYWDQSSCAGNGYNWTPGRRSYANTGSDVFSAYMELQEDLNILQMKRSDATGAERAANEEIFITAVQAARDRISGNKAGSSITAEEKDAIVKLLLPPQM
jgi:hypothetical protein